jgi:hypothetical protein
MARQIHGFHGTYHDFRELQWNVQVVMTVAEGVLYCMWLTPKNTWLTLGALVLVGSSGCGRPEGGEAEAGRRPAARIELQLSQEARAAIGLATEPVRRQIVQETTPAAGWLMAQPGNDVAIKAAATGFVLPVNGTVLAGLGAEVSEQQPLGSLRLFLSPQEEAQMVALKEEADILIRQSLASLQAAEDRYRQVREPDAGRWGCCRCCTSGSRGGGDGGEIRGLSVGPVTRGKGQRRPRMLHLEASHSAARR